VEGERIFLMMDAVSVEKALKEGAERYASRIDFSDFPWT